MLAAQRFSPSLAFLNGAMQPLAADAYVRADAAAPRASEWRALGEQAIRKGEVAFLLLNGGMATRFGGIAKGAARALGERSFLALRMQQAKAVGDALGARVPCVLMNSFATDAATAEHLRAHDRFGFGDDLFTMVQGISVRLTEAGELFRDGAQKVSLYTPGHGDLPWALEVSGIAAQLKARGVKTLFVSNVDNVGCTLDPLVLGAHLASGAELSVETTDRDAKDVGGAPIVVDGKLQLVEGFRLPPSFDQSVLTGFNTNTFYFQWSALRPEIPLGFYAVAKKVDGRTAIQFERIVGEVTAHVQTTYLKVLRDAENGRFLPVKAPEDLISLQPLLQRRYGAV